MFKKGLIIGSIIGSLLSISALGYIYTASKNSKEVKEKVAALKNFKSLDIPLIDLEGNKIDLAKYNDKTILVNIWGTWCPPCVKEMPLLQEVYTEIKDKYVFVMISDEGIQKIKEYKENNQYDFEFIVSEKNLNPIIGVFPSTFILDKNQNITYFKAGSFDEYTTQSLKEFLLQKAN